MRTVVTLVKLSLGLLVALVYLTVGWIPGLIILGVWLVGLAVAARRTSIAYDDFTRCPLGHAVPQYGTGRCGACGAVSEGSLWECLHCGAVHGFVGCHVCGLSVPNPMLRE